MSDIVQPSPFPEFLRQQPDISSTVQFIGAAASHAELGRSNDVIEQLNLFPDKVFARNIALYLLGSTANEEYKKFIDKHETDPQLLEMSNIAKSALSIYFNLEPINMVETVSATDLKTQREEVRSDVWCNLSSLRITVQSTTGNELVHAKAAYDKELIVSVKKLMDVADFDIAHDFASHSLTEEGRIGVQAEYDKKIFQIISSTNDSSELIKISTLPKTTFTPYGKLAAETEYDRRIVEAIKLLDTTDDLNIANSLVNSCMGLHGIFEAKRAYDIYLIKRIKVVLSINDIDNAKRLSRCLKTSKAAEVASDLIGQRGKF